MLESRQYVGADIWRFFSEGQVQDYCIEPSDEYSNTLLILTDGYLYHDNSVQRIGNRTSYVTGPLLQREGLRESTGLQKISDDDYGLIDTPKLSSQLSALIVEVNPSDANKGDYSILDQYLGKWFNTMGVDKYRLLKTDIPANTKEIIQRFLQQR